MRKSVSLFGSFINLGKCNCMMNMGTYDRNEVLNSISDASKEAYGYRVRRDYAALSDEDLFATYEGYLNDASRAAREEAEREEEAKEAWNAHLCRLMHTYGLSRRDALRWDMQANGVEGEVRDYCYLLGISYYTEGKTISRELN
jgi:hypothetical protein